MPSAMKFEKKAVNMAPLLSARVVVVGLMQSL
jgi:hypothetical protein